MPSSPSADPAHFDEAIAWFRSRLIVTDQEFKQLTEDARARAFKVAGVAQLDLVNEIWRALDSAVAKGTTLQDFKREIRESLEAAWDSAPDRRLDTIFRTNIQTAYSAGRYAQMTEPAVMKARPYWRFVALLDSRTTPICRPLDGVVKHAEDPWWNSHNPPLHFNCRSTVQTLRASQVNGEDHQVPPDVTVPKGFGHPRKLDAWEPNLDGVAPELRHVYQRKNADT